MVNVMNSGSLAGRSGGRAACRTVFQTPLPPRPTLPPNMRRLRPILAVEVGCFFKRPAWHPRSDCTGIVARGRLSLIASATIYLVSSHIYLVGGLVEVLLSVGVCLCVTVLRGHFLCWDTCRGGYFFDYIAPHPDHVRSTGLCYYSL